MVLLNQHNSEDETRIVDESLYVSTVRLFEAFLEAGPQLILQLYIMLQVEQDTPPGNFSGK